MTTSNTPDTTRNPMPTGNPSITLSPRTLARAEHGWQTFLRRCAQSEAEPAHDTQETGR